MLAEKVSLSTKYAGVLLYSNDRLVGFLNPCLSLFISFVKVVSCGIFDVDDM